MPRKIKFEISLKVPEGVSITNTSDIHLDYVEDLREQLDFAVDSLYRRYIAATRDPEV